MKIIVVFAGTCSTLYIANFIIINTSWQRNSFEAICGATADCNQPGDKCPMVSGKCDHRFHYHCVKKWLNTPQSEEQCPLCRSKWEYSDLDFLHKFCQVKPMQQLPIPNIPA